MSSEVLLLNRQAVAMAADTAVTSRVTDRVQAGAQKIFPLFDDGQVGVMVYGASEMVDTPWSIICDDFAKHLGPRRFSTVMEYGAELVHFLGEMKKYFTAQGQESCVIRAAQDTYTALEWFMSSSPAGRAHTPKQEMARAARRLQERVEQEPQLDPLPKRFGKKVRDRYRGVIATVLREGLGTRRVSKETDAAFLELVSERLQRKMPDSPRSGVVFTGFGKKERFPGFVCLELHGVVADWVLLTVEDVGEVGPDVPSIVRGFAQQQALQRLRFGMDDELREQLVEFTSNLAHASASGAFDGLSGLAPGSVESRVFANRLRVALVGRLDWFLDLQSGLRDEALHRVIAGIPAARIAPTAKRFIEAQILASDLEPPTPTVGGGVDAALITRKSGFAWYAHETDLRALS